MASTYNLAALGDLPPPPRENLFAAARYMTRLAEANGIAIALIGGLAMNIRGSMRDTVDIDLVLGARMIDINAIFRQQPRLAIPNTVTLDNITKVFVHTGPKYGDLDCSTNFDIEADVMAEGHWGTPSSIANHQQYYDVENLTGHPESFPLLDLFSAMKAKLYAYQERKAMKDFHDIKFLLDHYGNEISRFSDKLDESNCSSLLESMESMELVTQEEFNRYIDMFGMKPLQRK